MNAHFLSSSEKKKMLSELNERFGIHELNYLFVETGKEKIRGFSGSLSREELVHLGSFTRVELVGAYFFRQDKVTGLRMSFDAPLILKDQITQGIVDITKEQFEEWIRGVHLDMDTTNYSAGSYVVRCDGDFVGCGFVKNGKLYNYVPRERQLKTKRL